MAISLEARADGRVYTWREYGNVAHLTELPIVNWPAWTVCGRPVGAEWRIRSDGVLRPLCSYCSRWDAMVMGAGEGNRD